MGQSKLADQQSVNEQAVEQSVNERAGEQGAVEQAESTEEEVIDRGGIDAAEAAAAGDSNESAAANEEHDSADTVMSAGDASDEVGTS